MTLWLLLGTIVASFAQDFKIEDVNYEIISSDPAEVKIVRSPEVFGIVFIPEKVSYKSKSYTVVGIDRFAFGLTKLTGIELPDTVVSIGEYAFAKTKLSEIVLPKKLQIINDYAFKAVELESVTIKSTDLLDATADAFADVEVTVVKLIVPKSSIAEYKNAAIWEDFAIITSVKGNFEDNAYVNANK